MWQKGVTGKNKRVVIRFFMLLILGVLLVPFAFAQHDPEKEKEERLNRIVPPKAAPSHYRPSKNRLLVLTNRGTPPGNIKDPPPPIPSSILPPTPVPPPPPGFSNVILDLSKFEADLTDDPQLHIYIDDKELPNKQSPTAPTDFILENIPVGSHTLKITHPMIDDYSLPISVKEANKPARFAKIPFELTKYRLIVLTEPLATVCINGNCLNRADEDGYVVVYLSPQDPYDLKATKDGFQPKVETQVNLGKSESVFDLHLTKKNP